ncbi:MAG: DUF454 domain-containing protein [Clostridiales bacterium]|jgi:uncharacterized membrane protein YbaN (DUF454 family)|nr:DUF454 domain-containing protein [Clostridiales bacterium]
MSLKNILLSAAGLVLLAMGAVGLVLPVWPTTPFVLAAAGCFANNPKLRARVMRISFFREYLENYRDRKGLSKRTVARSLCFLWGMLALSATLSGRVWVILCLAAVGIGVTSHILWIARPRPR